MFKALIGYDIAAGVSEAEYEEWLFGIHSEDLLANPYLNQIVFNKVLGPVTATSGNAAAINTAQSFYRIAELHFDDEDSYRAYRQWFDEHPIPPERGPAGRTDFRFYVVATTTVVTRSDLRQ